MDRRVILTNAGGKRGGGPSREIRAKRTGSPQIDVPIAWNVAIFLGYAPGSFPTNSTQACLDSHETQSRGEETPEMANEALNDPAEIPAELDRWNWGAFFLSWIWGVGNSTWIALLALIPFVNIVMMFVLGFRGSRWAWQNRAWRSADHFRRSQRGWGIAGLVVWIVMICGGGSLVFSMPRILKSSDAYGLTMRAVQSDQEVIRAIGPEIHDSFWIFGQVTVNYNGTGNANYSIPIHGEKGSGTVISQATREGNRWTIRQLIVNVDGQQKPIIIIRNSRPGGIGA